MALKALVTDINTVPEPLRGEYIKQDDGTFILDVTDSEYRTKLQEFRNNNLQLSAKEKELNAKIEQYKDVDPKKYAEAVKALERLNELEDADAIKNGKLDEVLQKRTATMKADYDNQIRAKDQALDQAKQQLAAVTTNFRDLKLNQEIISTIDQVGVVRKGALPDIISRAKGEWAVDENGALLAKNPDGTQKYGKDGQPLTVAEWGKSLLQNAAHLFEPGTGGGAKGGKKGESNQVDPKVLKNPSPAEFGKHAADIASGKITVVMDDANAE